MKKIFWTFFLLYITVHVHSQEVPYAFTVRNGTIIILSESALASGYFTIERRIPGKENFEPWNLISQPGSLLEFKGLVLNYSQYFYPLAFNDSQLEKIWEEYQKNKQENKPGVYMLHPAMWLACGLACIDTSAIKGRFFEYKVSLIKNGKNVWSKIISTGISEKKKLILYSDSYHSITRENSILLEWHIPERDKPAYFDVFRTETQKNNLQNISSEKGFYNENDSLVLVSQDSMVAPGEIYTYYFQTYDFWGNPAKTQAVNLFASGMSDKPNLSDFRSRAVKEGVRLHWIIRNPKKIASVTILRSLDFDTGFRKIAEVAAKDTAFTDQAAIPATNYYYLLNIRLIDGSVVTTTKVAGYPLITPRPEPPRHFNLISNKNGISMTWQGREKWIAGYAVFRANGCKGKMSQLSPIIKPGKSDTFRWTDQSVDLKGSMVYSYAVRAFSPNMETSIFSDTVCVSPDVNVNPPMTPTHIKIRREDKKAFVTWDNQASKDRLLLGFNIYRKTVSLYNSDKAEPAKKLNPEILRASDNFFIDTTILSGFRYEYSVEAINIKDLKSGLSYPISIEITEPDPVSPAGISLFNTTEGILIKWDGTSQEKLASYLVYRFDANNKPRLIYTAKPDERSFTDKEVKKEVLYFYYVTSITMVGKASRQQLLL